MTWAVEQELPAMQKIVLLMLANRTNHDTGLCFPSHDTLAKECGMDKRSVINQIAKLEAAGLLSVNRSTNKPNSYTLNLSSDTKSPGERDSPLAVKEIHLDSERDSPEPVTNLKRTVVVTREEFLNLTEEQSECKNWAATQNYWASCTQTDQEFLKVWCKPNGTLRKQYDVHKKALQDGLGQTGLNVPSNKTQKNIGVNYATHHTNSKPLTATQIRNNLAQLIAESEQRNANIINSTALYT